MNLLEDKQSPTQITQLEKQKAEGTITDEEISKREMTFKRIEEKLKKHEIAIERTKTRIQNNKEKLVELEKVETAEE